MSITATRTVTVGFSGDIAYGPQPFSALDNLVSPGQTDLTSFVSGANTITAPVVSGVVVTGLTIIPPAGNTTAMTMKGVSGDSGFPIHKTDPTSIGIDTGFTSLIISAASTITGVRVIWS